MGNPTKSFVLVLFAITLYLVSLKTPHITINRQTIILLKLRRFEVALMDL